MIFCQELERTAARYPEAPIVVTSRIVGYRDMPYRMGSGFEHGQIAELNREDKDLFARRWSKSLNSTTPPRKRPGAPRSCWMRFTRATASSGSPGTPCC